MMYKVSITLILISLFVASVYAAKSIDMETLELLKGANGCTYDAVAPDPPDWPDCDILCLIVGCDSKTTYGASGYCVDKGYNTGKKIKNSAKQTDYPSRIECDCGGCLVAVCVGMLPCSEYGSLTECELTSC